MNLSDLANGQSVEARFARGDVWNEQLGRYVPNWGVWQNVTLYLRRREKPLPKSRRGGKVGDIIELTPQEKDWASYSQADYSEEHDEWVAEDYRMQIRPA